MPPPFALPDWLPLWAPIAMLVPLGLYALAFLMMPFSVFGLKGRLDAIDARLDEIQGEIRSLSLRLPEPGIGYDRELLTQPPIPPQSQSWPMGSSVPPREPRLAEARPIDLPPIPQPPANRPVIRRPDAVRRPRSEPSFDPS